MPLDASGNSGPGSALNVLGGRLQACSNRPVTGYFRNGCCNTGPDDFGSHTVCAVMTAEFLAFSKKSGNDLSTPRPEFGFAGLLPGDRWCLCAPRWQEALRAGSAPRVVLRATEESALGYCSLADLKRLAVDFE
jgi:uncharacterized protein (DUF2237 family)